MQTDKLHAKKELRSKHRTARVVINDKAEITYLTFTVATPEYALQNFEERFTLAKGERIYLYDLTCVTSNGFKEYGGDNALGMLRRYARLRDFIDEGSGHKHSTEAYQSEYGWVTRDYTPRYLVYSADNTSPDEYPTDPDYWHVDLFGDREELRQGIAEMIEDSTVDIVRILDLETGEDVSYTYEKKVYVAFEDEPNVACGPTA